MSALLAAGAVLLAFAAARELAGEVGDRLAAVLRVRLGNMPGSGGRSHALARLAGAAGGAAVAFVAVPALPPRLGFVAGPLLIAAGFVGPDAIAERRARRRRDRFVAALPDALDILAVGSASGRGLASLMGRLRATGGPLAAELDLVVASIECGVPPREAIADLRRRLRGPEIAAFAAAVERSHAYGSPLAEQLHLQATALRSEARRRIEEHAARAAPKIQLVVALVLVPSVLLMILAAIVAHADALIAGL